MSTAPNTFPVNKGILNTKLTTGPKYHAASLEQVITAIDQINGSIDWRRTGFEDEEEDTKRDYIDGADLHIICNAGHGVSLVRAAMAAGCPGATIEPMRLLQLDDGLSTKKMSPARERSKIMIKHNKIKTIIDAIDEAGAFTETKQTLVFSQDVPKAFTYFRGKAS
ncbi:MAG: hypothetical protein HRU19_17755 [Pseudobacteriovorax sp.]|nr:hypothetical protein [Pseudobacteriovorax sp.]